MNFVDVPDSVKGPELMNANQGTPDSIVKDKSYFFDIIVIQVENTLFRVPKQGFMVEGSVFRDMYECPLPSDTDSSTVEGTSIETPLNLAGISVSHFRGLLRAMYPFTQTPLTYDEWIGALHLAKMWNFTEIRERAIAHISPLLSTKEVYDNILLGKKYEVRQWLIDGYASLAAQTGIPNVEKLAEKGLDGFTIARIFCLRENVRLKKPSSPNSNARHQCTSCQQECNLTGFISSDHGCGNHRCRSICRYVLSPVDPVKFYNDASRDYIPSIFSVEFSRMPYGRISGVRNPFCGRFVF